MVLSGLPWSLVLGTKTWTGQQDMSTSEARKYVICCFVMSTCVTFLIFRHCNGPHQCHVMCHVALIMSAKQSSYDDFDITTPRNQPTQQLMLGELTQSSAGTLQLPRKGVFTFENKWSPSGEIESQSETIIPPWHDVSQLIPTMNFNAPHNTQD